MGAEPRRVIHHIVALKLAASAVARYEYDCELWQLTQAQQRICEGLAAVAVGAYVQSQSFSKRAAEGSAT